MLIPSGDVLQNLAMPYMVRVGAIEANVSGVGARGYAVWRSATTVYVQFGKIEVVGSGTSKFCWRRTPKLLRYRRKSIEAARALAKALIAAQLRPSVKGSYQKLPPGTRIRTRRKRR